MCNSVYQQKQEKQKKNKKILIFGYIQVIQIKNINVKK
jgi:hypothetical protein